MSTDRNEHPIERVYPNGKKVYLARYTDKQGKRRSAGTFSRKKDAQKAINDAYRVVPRRGAPTTVGGYNDIWLNIHPRTARTDASYRHRMSRVLDVKLEGVPLRDWPLDDLRRRHASALIDHMLREQRRAAKGAVGILRILSAMAEDAIHDEVMETNPFLGAKVRASDPRVTKAPREQRVFTFEQMHRFAGNNPMLRCFTDLGLRLGEGLALPRAAFRRSDDGWIMEIRQSAHEGIIQAGTKNDHGETEAGRVVPVPPTLAAMLVAMPKRIDTELLFPTKRGKVWRESNFRRNVWEPAQRASGIDIRPHECRHSWISHLAAQGIDEADLAAMAGHTVATMNAHYRHAVNQSLGLVREAIG